LSVRSSRESESRTRPCGALVGAEAFRRRGPAGEYWLAAGVIRTALGPATGPPKFGPTHLGVPARTRDAGNFCHGNSPPLSFHAASPRATEVTSRAPPTLPLPSPDSRCVERPGVRFDPCAWRSSSGPSCHPIREGGISPDPRVSPMARGEPPQRERERERERELAEELARAYTDGALPSGACSYAGAFRVLVFLDCWRNRRVPCLDYHTARC